MRPIKKCVVCLNYVKYKIKAVPRHSLEEQVLITFLFRKLSWTCLTEGEFQGFLQEWGNPSDWAAVCHICEKQVNEALSLHKQIMNLIRRISDIRRKLYTENFYESDEEEEDGGNQAFFKLRRLLISDFKDQNWLQREFRRSMVLNYHSNSTSDLTNNGRLKSKPTEKIFIKDELMSDNDSNLSGFLLEATDDISMDHYQSDEDKEKDTNAQSRSQNVKKRRYSDDNYSEMSGDDDPGEDTSKSSTDPPWKETSHKSSRNSSVVNAVKVDKWPENLARGTKQCPVCKKKFVNGSSMRRHFRETHLESKESLTPCPHCNKTFPKKQYLLPHIESVHPEKLAETISSKPEIKCPMCPSKFKLRKALKRHMHLTHGDGGEIFHCNQCNKKYYRKDSLINHKQFVHNEQSSPNVGSLNSSNAGVGLSSNELDENESQENIARRTCDKCGKIFQSEHVKKRHISESHEKIKEHSCDQCSKTFARRSYLFRHIYNDHSDGDTDPMPCKVCGRICIGSSALAGHMRQVHKQRQNASCEVCGRTYSQIAALNIHKKFAHPDNTKTETNDVDIDKEGNATTSNDF